VALISSLGFPLVWKLFEQILTQLFKEGQIVLGLLSVHQHFLNE
jgi:hypothetical protein